MAGIRDLLNQLKEDHDLSEDIVKGRDLFRSKFGVGPEINERLEIDPNEMVDSHLDPFGIVPNPKFKEFKPFHDKRIIVDQLYDTLVTGAIQADLGKVTEQENINKLIGDDFLGLDKTSQKELLQSGLVKESDLVEQVPRLGPTRPVPDLNPINLQSFVDGSGVGADEMVTDQPVAQPEVGGFLDNLLREGSLQRALERDAPFEGSGGVGEILRAADPGLEPVTQMKESVPLSPQAQRQAFIRRQTDLQTARPAPTKPSEFSEKLSTRLPAEVAATEEKLGIPFEQMSATQQNAIIQRAMAPLSSVTPEGTPEHAKAIADVKKVETDTNKVLVDAEHSRVLTREVRQRMSESSAKLDLELKKLQTDVANAESLIESRESGAEHKQRIIEMQEAAATLSEQRLKLQAAATPMKALFFAVLDPANGLSSADRMRKLDDILQQMEGTPSLGLSNKDSALADWLESFGLNTIAKWWRGNPDINPKVPSAVKDGNLGRLSPEESQALQRTTR